MDAMHFQVVLETSEEFSYFQLAICQILQPFVNETECSILTTQGTPIWKTAEDLLELMSDFRGYRENCVSLPKAKRTVVSSSRNYAERDSSALFNVNRSVQNQKGVTLTTQRRSARFIDVFPAIGWYFCVSAATPTAQMEIRGFRYPRQKTTTMMNGRQKSFHHQEQTSGESTPCVLTLRFS